MTKLTKEQQLYNFIKAGRFRVRSWSECRSFYTSISPELCFYKVGDNEHWMGGGFFNLTAEEALKLNHRRTGRAMDYALYRIEQKGWTKNIDRGLHRAINK